MDVQFLSQSDDKCNLVIKGINPALANTIRRLVIDEVPTLTIDTVTLNQNSSAMYDEMLVHRLGLIPLITDLKSYVKKEDCKCEGKGCASCQLVMSLKAEGPATVYSGEIKSKDKAIKPVYDKMPLVKLLKGQEVDISCIAVLGPGKLHAKFSPGLMFYQGVPAFAIESGVKVPVCEMHKSLVPATKSMKASEKERCMLCFDYDKEGVTSIPSKEDFLFTLESWGQLTCKEILNAAMDSMETKLDQFDKQLKKLKF
ncbi:MAG: DNA-directed RNA polymerase subunit D [Nanoarchaeota archaeon]